ncbi:ribose ABC transporter permease [Gottschalkiaceae bacterium SANA]|nr:ribose ABC transporter permease [Gottschalkiaceae bacterium SANA]
MMETTMKKENKQTGILDKINAFRKRYSESTLGAILIVFIIIMSFASDRFLTLGNISNLLRSTSIVGVAAVGMTFVIISAGIDLSVGSVLGLSGIIAALLMTSGVPIILSVIGAMICGTVVGVIQGWVIHKGSVPPFIATLAGMMIIRGGVMLITGANMVSGLPKSFRSFATAEFLGLPAVFFIWVVVLGLGAFIAKYTKFGRNIYAIGSNEEAARLSGINIKKNIVAVYGFCAFTASIAGVLFLVRLGNGIPSAGQGYEMDAVAAAVVGGASLMGAEGSILGTFLGAIIIAMIRNGGNLLGINPFILNIIVGSLIVIAVLLDQQGKKQGK